MVTVIDHLPFKEYEDECKVTHRIFLEEVHKKNANLMSNAVQPAVLKAL